MAALRRGLPSKPAEMFTEMHTVEDKDKNQEDRIVNLLLICNSMAQKHLLYQTLPPPSSLCLFEEQKTTLAFVCYFRHFGFIYFVEPLASVCLRQQLLILLN